MNCNCGKCIRDVHGENTGPNTDMSDMPVRIWALELCNHMGCTRKDVSENDNYTKYYRGDLVRELKSLLSQVHIGQDNNQNDWLYPETGESDWIIARDKAIVALEGGSDE